MRRALTFATLFGLALLACDDETSSSGPADCRRAEHECADGYRCAFIGGGIYDCVQSRDAEPMLPDALQAADMGEGDALLDAASFPDTGLMTQDMGTLTADAHNSMSSDGAPEMDAEALLDVGQGGVDSTHDQGRPMDEMRMPNPVPDVGVANPDQGQHPDEGMAVIDAAIVNPMDMGGGAFGPGRCNYDAMHPREPADLGGQDQNGARQTQPGQYNDLTVGGIDWADWYRVEVCAGGVIEIEVDHPFDGVDLELDVWHPNLARLGQSTGQCTGREFYRWQNDGDIVDIRFNVYPWAPPGRDGNNRYSLSVRVMCD